MTPRTAKVVAVPACIVAFACLMAFRFATPVQAKPLDVKIDRALERLLDDSDPILARR